MRTGSACMTRSYLYRLSRPVETSGELGDPGGPEDDREDPQVEEAAEDEAGLEEEARPQLAGEEAAVREERLEGAPAEGQVPEVTHGLHDLGGVEDRQRHGAPDAVGGETEVVEALHL